MSDPGGEKAGGALRALAAVAALALFFGAAVMVLVVLNPDNLPLCGDVDAGKAVLGSTRECFESSRTEYDIARAFAGAAAIVGAIAGLLGLYVGVTGKRGSLMLKLTGLALVLGIATVLIG